MSKLHRLARLVAIAGLLVAFLAPQPVQANPPRAGNSFLLPIQSKTMVDPGLAAQVKAGPAQAMIYLREHADLSPAEALLDKTARRQFVFNTLRTTAERSGGELLRWLQAAGSRPRQLWIANAIAATLDAGQLAAVAARPEVAQVRLSQAYFPEAIWLDGPGLEPATVEWNIAKIRADEAWSELGVTGEGAVVGEIDTGVQYDHPALVNQYRGNLGGSFDHNYSWFDFVAGQPAPYDPNGHGTFGMGLAVGDDGGGNQIGVAPGADWIAVRACDMGCTDADLLAAGEWMLAPYRLDGTEPDPSKAPDVVLNMWGGGTGCDSWYDSVLTAWRAAGIVPVFSPGGAGPACGGVGSPAASPNAFAAGATDANDQIGSFSSRGPSACGGIIKPDVVAPGVEVRSSVSGSGYAVYSGTSFSAAHLAGAIALVASANPLLGVTEIETILKDSALCIQDLSCGGTECPDGANNVYGSGRIDAYEAVVLAQGGQQASWTFMVYMAADNNLEGAGITDFLEMATAGSDANLNIVVQFDRIPGYDNLYGDWTTTKRFLVGPGMTPTPQNAIMDIGEANMGDPQTAIEFVTWARQNFPAQNYALIFWNHGGGWLDDFTRPEGDDPLPEDFCWDDTNGGDALTSAELYNLLDTTTGGGTDPLEQVGFDACLMAMWEVDNQIKPFGSVVSVSSEETEPWDGWPYHTILGVLKANPGWTPEELGSDIVDRYFESYGNSETQSAKSLTEPYTALNEAVDEFAMELIAFEPGYHNQYNTARNAAQNFGAGFIDLSDFALKIKTYVAEPAVQAAADAVIAAVEAAVIHEHHGGYWPGAHGIDFYFPSSLGGWAAYKALSSSQLTHWDEFVEYHITGVLPCDYVHIEQMAYTFDELNVTFTPTISGDPPIDFLWSFGDGVTSTVSTPVMHTYPDYGVYEASLEVTNCSGDGNDTWLKQIQLIPGCSNPVALVDVSYTVEDLTVSFDLTVAGEEPINYLWDFGDGQTSSEADPVHTYASYGDYEVSLQVSNCGGLATDGWEEIVEVRDLPCLLLVDDDNNDPDVTPFYTGALDELDIAYDVWEIATAGNPAAEDLAPYATLVWYTGDDYGDTTFTPDNEAAVSAFLEAGGKFFLSSQDYLYDFGLTPFGQNYLHIGSFTSDTGDATTAYALNVFDGLGPYPLVYPAGLMDYADIVNPDAAALVAFQSQSSGGNNLAISYEGNPFKTIFFGFPFEALDGEASRAEVMDRILDFLGGCDCEAVTGAGFTYAPPDPVNGEPVTFYGTVTAGTPPYAFTWDFGDGLTGSGQSPAHVFAAPGTYTVTLTVTNTCGESEAVQAVVVDPSCVDVTAAGLTLLTPGVLVPGDEAEFEVDLAPDTATPPFSYAVNGGEVQQAETEPFTFTLAFAEPGTFPVEVGAWNCEMTEPVTDTLEVFICEPLDGVSFAWLPEAPVAGAEVLFEASVLTGTLPYAYTWDFGDGEVGVGITATHTYAAPGEYTATLMVENACGVEDVSHVILVAEPCEPVTGADFTWEPAEFFAGDEVTFTGSALTGTLPYTFDWLVSDDLTVTEDVTGTGEVFTHLFEAAGSYTVTLTVSNECGSETVAVGFVVAEPVYTAYLPVVLRAYLQP